MDDSIRRIENPVRILPARDGRGRRAPRRGEVEPGSEPERDEREGEDTDDLSLGRATHFEPGRRIDLSA